MGLITMSELGGLSAVDSTAVPPAPPRRKRSFLPIGKYNEFVRKYGHGMAYDLNVAPQGAQPSFYAQQKLLAKREAVSEARRVPGLTYPGPSITITQGDEEREIEVPDDWARKQRIVTGRSRWLRGERQDPRRERAGEPFTFKPGDRPGDVFPGHRPLKTAKGGPTPEQVRHQAILQKVKRGAEWGTLTHTAQVARLQKLEMSRRGVKVVKPKGWVSEKIDTRAAGRARAADRALNSMIQALRREGVPQSEERALAAEALKKKWTPGYAASARRMRAKRKAYEERELYAAAKAAKARQRTLVSTAQTRAAQQPTQPKPVYALYAPYAAQAVQARQAQQYRQGVVQRVAAALAPVQSWTTG